MLPLPWLFHLAARNLVGPGVVANAAVFLPLLVPGLARSATSINNDNLAVGNAGVRLGRVGQRDQLLIEGGHRGAGRPADHGRYDSGRGSDRIGVCGSSGSGAVSVTPAMPLWR